MTPEAFNRLDREARWLWPVASSAVDLLARPPGEFRDWRDLAACAQADPEAFFPAAGDTAALARRVCARCDVRAECLEWALAHLEEGIWAGLDYNARRKLAARRAAEAAA